MSNAVKAVIGTFLVYEGYFMSLAGAPEFGVPMTAIGEALLLNAAVDQFFGPKSPSAPPLTGSSINYAGTLEPRRIIYGRLKVGGINCMPPFTTGANNDYLHQVLAFAGHPIDGFEDVYFGQTRIPTADIGSIPRTASDGLLGGSSGYQAFAWIRRYDGSQTQSDYILTSQLAAWDATHIGADIPYAAVQFKYDQKVYSGGFPQASFVLRGKKVYDPRMDSTNGGSGSQRYATPSTWTYSTNPALCLRDYLTSTLGLGEAQARINDTLVAAAANICDQTCTVPIPVLTGLTNWTNGSVNVTGINTAFLSVLSNGYYLKAPNGSMLLISSVVDDTTIHLSSGYSGANASGQVTQYNSTNATTKTQARYTCNVLLDCTATFQANITTLAGSMMGHCLYSGGKWLMYAGAWTGSAFALGADDVVGTVSTQAGTPRANCYNAVRGNFIDPQSNYQPVEFPPILDANYLADDGERIFVETNFPACIDLFEAQRNAILWNRFGRNQWVVTAQFGMSAFGIKVWETGTVTIPELGWNGQTVRCIGWKFDPRGIVELTLQEAYSADWTDPNSSTDYVIKGVNVGPAAGRYVPYPPSGLTATPVAGGIVFTVTLPDQVIPGTTIQLYQHTAATPFSSAVKVAQGNSDTFTLPADTTQKYYWVRTLGPNGQTSTTYPATSGLGASGGQTSNAFVAVGGCTLSYDDATKYPAGTSAWDACVYTIQGHDTCHISGKPTYAGATSRCAIGLSSNPIASPSYTNMDFGWYNISTGWEIREGGTKIGSSYDVPTTMDLAAVTYDSSSGHVTYLLNGVVQHTTNAAAGLTLYGFCPFYDPYAALNCLEFGPTTNIAVSDTAQLGDGAAADVLVTTAAGPTSLINSQYVSMASVTVGPYPYPTTVVFTATGTWNASIGSSAGALYLLAAIYYGSLLKVEDIHHPSTAETANTSPSGGYAIEYTASLGAGQTRTYNVELGWTVGSATTTVAGSATTIKAEVIKK